MVSDRVFVGVVVVRQASMEPCLFRHGKRREPGRVLVAGRASMEPCLFRHGKAQAQQEKKLAETELQWSHVFSDMVRALILKYIEINGLASMEPCLFRHGKFHPS